MSRSWRAAERRRCICGRQGLVLATGKSVCSGCGRLALYCSCAEADLLPIAAPVIMAPSEVRARLSARWLG